MPGGRLEPGASQDPGLPLPMPEAVRGAGYSAVGQAGLSLATPEARVGAPDSTRGSEPAAQHLPVCSLTSGQQLPVHDLRLLWVQCSPHRSPSTPLLPSPGPERVPRSILSWFLPKVPPDLTGRRAGGWPHRARNRSCIPWGSPVQPSLPSVVALGAMGVALGWTAEASWASPGPAAPEERGSCEGRAGLWRATQAQRMLAASCRVRSLQRLNAAGAQATRGTQSLSVGAQP